LDIIYEMTSASLIYHICRRPVSCSSLYPWRGAHHDCWQTYVWQPGWAFQVCILSDI